MNMYYINFPYSTTIAVTSDLDEEGVLDLLLSHRALKASSGIHYNLKNFSSFYKITHTDLTPMVLSEVLI